MANGRTTVGRIVRPLPPQRRRDAVATLQGEYTQWLDALPEPLRDSATGEALQAVVDLDLDELLAIEPPHGFGRD